MHPFSGLLRKELRLTRNVFFFLTGVYLLGALTLFSWPIAKGSARAEIFLVLGSFVILLVCMFIVTVFTVKSLGEERKQLQLWLHNPQPAWKLLAAKLLVATGKGLVFIISGVYLLHLLISKYWDEDWLAKVGGGTFLFETGAVFILASVGCAIWYLFAWSFYCVLRKRFGRWSFWLTLAFIILLGWLFIKLETLPLFEQLFTAAESEMNKAALKISGDHFHLLLDLNMSFNAPYIVYQIFTSAILFAISSWLIDNAVEV